jgi:hypothetical protein
MPRKAKATTAIVPPDNGGPFDRFREATRRILSVSKEEMAERERVDRLTRKPHGPKPTAR